MAHVMGGRRGDLTTLAMFGVILGSLALQPIISTADSARFTPQTKFHTDGRGTPRVDFVTEEALLHGLIALPGHEQPISPKRMAEDYLKLNCLRYGLSPTLAELTLVGCRRSLLGHHCRFQESIAGHDVLEAELNVSMDLNSRVTMVVNTTYPLADVDRIPTEPRISADEIMKLIEVDAGQRPILSVPRLNYLPRGHGFILVYETHATLRAPIRYFRYLVDAQSGEILRRDGEASDQRGEMGATLSNVLLFLAIFGPAYLLLLYGLRRLARKHLTKKPPSPGDAWCQTPVLKPAAVKRWWRRR